MANKEYFVYILANERNTVFYTGMSGDLPNRLDQHYFKDYPKSFTARYNINKLIYFEVFENVYEAINREKEIKHWRRSKKLALIKTINPTLKDISDSL